MPFLTALIGALLTVASSLVGRVLLALGLSFVTYSGLNTSIDWLLAQIKSNMGSMPAEIVAFLGWMWVDRAISMIFSAYVVAMSFKLAGGSVLKGLVRK